MNVLNFIYILISIYIFITLYDYILFHIENQRINKLMESIKIELNDIQNDNVCLNENRKNKISNDIELLIDKTYKLTNKM